MVVNVSFLFANIHELAALMELPLIQRVTYLMGIRPYMDRQSNIVGIKRKISYQSLREVLYVGPIAGVKTGSPSRQQVKRAVKSLERAGLIEIESTNKNLILKCPLAALDKTTQNKADLKPTHKAVTKPSQLEVNELEAFYNNTHHKADSIESTEADPPQKSEVDYINLFVMFEKFDPWQ